MMSADRRPRHRGLRSLLALLGVLALGVPAGAVAGAPIVAALPDGVPTSAAAADPTAGDPAATAGTTAPRFQTGQILPGVHVGSVDLSGLDEAAARQALAAGFASIGQGQIVLNADGASTTISYAAINRRLDVDTMIGEAFNVGRSGDAMARIVALVYTMGTGTDLTPVIIFDELALNQRVAEAANALSRPYVNAKVVRTATGFTTVGSGVGRRFDATAQLPALTTQLRDPGAPSQLTATLDGADWQPTISNDEAQAAATAATTISAPLVLANGGQTWTIPSATVRTWIYFKGVNGALQPYGNESVIGKSIAVTAKDINRDAISASWQFGPKGVVVVPAKNGRQVDIPMTARRIAGVLAGRAAGTFPLDKLVGPTVTATQPTLTTEQAEKQSAKFKLLSTWTTYFAPAAHNGFGANIWVPAHYLDNQVVQPGETFSFWDRVGEVSLARGYKMGGAIVGGHTQEGVALAGGICSTSTTLFNAALRAGFKMGERSNHYYYITRYPVGLDATVSKTAYGQQNMTWTNDTPYPVLIKSFKTGGSVTFSLYGIPTGRKVTFSNPIIKNYIKATSEVVPISTIPTGRLVRIEYPDDGFDSWVTAFVRDASGNLISDRTYVSHYGMVKGVQYVGDPNGKPISVPSYAPGAQGG